MAEYFYPKPEKEKDFKKAVAWFGGREMVASLKNTILYSIYGEKSDPRVWMYPKIYPDVNEKIKNKLSSVSLEQTVEPDAKKVNEKVSEFWRNKTLEQWDWKKNNFQVWEKYFDNSEEGNRFWQKIDKDGEFWFDYISDTGDGQMGVYSVACVCFSDLWLKSEDIGAEIKLKPPENFNGETLLSRGSFLFVGGDTAYHAADYTTLFERFQTPFRWAFKSVRKFMWKNYEIKDGDKRFYQNEEGQRVKIWDEENSFDRNWDGSIAEFEENELKKTDTEPLRPLFGIPANHDYYDAIAGFNKQFRRPPFKGVLENEPLKGNIGEFILKIPTFSREQEASFMAIHLPSGWWMFGIDSENKKMDFRQTVFFKDIVKKWMPEKLILATPEPTTVFGRKCLKTDKTAQYLSTITEQFKYEQPFLVDGELDKGIRLDLSGDVHHYARYWGPDKNNTTGKIKFASKNYASLVAGGGGAFFDTTDTLIGKNDTEEPEGEIPPKALYPSKDDSIRKTSKPLFDLENIRKGGYVQIAGFLIAVIIYFGLVSVLDFGKWLESADKFSFSNFGLGLTIVFVFMIALFIFGGNLIQKHVESLKEKLKKHNRNEDKINKKFVEGMNFEIAKRFIPIILGLLIYFALLLYFILSLEKLADLNFSSYIESWFLLFHFVFAGLLVWAALQYADWLPLKQRYSRIVGNKVNEWTNKMSKIPDALLYSLAISFVIIGIFIFGRSTLTILSAEILFTATFFGVFILIVFILGVNTGGKYQKGGKKFNFFLLGLIHAILQLLTPFILVYFFDMKFLLVVLGLIVIFHYLKGGAWIMDKNKAWLTFAVWFVFGAVVLIVPLILNNYKPSSLTERLKDLFDYFFTTTNLPDWVFLIATLFVVGLIGYFLSRVWLSWYLATSLAFNGHNNEAGGLARIEDFKHVLRIRLRKDEQGKDKLTVFVIGIDRAKPEIDQLNEPGNSSLRLVDRFDLTQ